MGEDETSCRRFSSRLLWGFGLAMVSLLNCVFMLLGLSLLELMAVQYIALFYALFFAMMMCGVASVVCFLTVEKRK